MGVITISINDRIERELRRLAVTRFSKSRGHLKKAITEAVEEWAEKRKEDVVTRSLELLEKGIKMGGMISKNRGDWHRR
ncbi:hypothetical protein J4462_01985 [Candidatus Pacearchaeota archaeon]|nr:hypothetical protein [Candidatus Pacearchaeota archaeon]